MFIVPTVRKPMTLNYKIKSLGLLSGLLYFKGDTIRQEKRTGRQSLFPLRFFLSFKLPFCVAKPTIGYLHEGNKHCPASQVAVVVNGDVRCVGSIPGLGRSPGGGHGNPLQCSCLENPMDRRAWLATVQELDMSKVT